MPEAVTTRGSFKVKVSAEHRTGFCENCETRTKKEFYMDGKRKRVRMSCPKCGGLGKLIVRTFSIEAPKPPQCLSARCLYQFFGDVLFCAVLSNYHRKRVAYAGKNRNKTIPLKYRTGEPSPNTIKHAIKDILILKTRR